MTDDNVTHLPPIPRSTHPSLREREVPPPPSRDPEYEPKHEAESLDDTAWLSTANRLRDDLASELEIAPETGGAFEEDVREFQKATLLRNPGAYQAAMPAYFEEPEEPAARPMRADTPWVWNTTLITNSVIGLAAFAISFGAIFEVAEWTGWAMWQRVLTPLLFDAGIVVFTFLSFIRLERGESARATFFLAEVLTVISAVIQVIHTLHTTTSTDPVELGVACLIAAMPPLILSASSYFVGRTIFRKR
jgi:hypothetical protein